MGYLEYNNIMTTYKPITELPQEVINAVYEGGQSLEGREPGEGILAEEDRSIIDANMKIFTHNLRTRKAEHAAALNGGLPTGGKLFFGDKSKLEFMAKLGIFFKGLEESNPELWEQLLRWAATRK
jgi:hypothetical protein